MAVASKIEFPTGTRINPIAFQAAKQPRRLTVNNQQAAAVEHLNKT
jgi:hypothetical protein